MRALTPGRASGYGGQVSGPPVGVLPHGQVWHASVAARGGLPIRAALALEAERQLAGVGDQALGEWHEWTGRAYHIRRRLSAREEQQTGPVADIRGTAEARERARAVGSMLRFAPPEVLAGELGEVQG